MQAMWYTTAGPEVHVTVFGIFIPKVGIASERAYLVKVEALHTMHLQPVSAWPWLLGRLEFVAKEFWSFLQRRSCKFGSFLYATKTDDDGTIYCSIGSCCEASWMDCLMRGVNMVVDG